MMRGGTLIQASPDGISNKVNELCYTNGNCEMTVAEFSEMKMALVVIYRTSGDNFSLSSFVEILDKTREYLTKLKAEKEDYRMML